MSPVWCDSVAHEPVTQKFVHPLRDQNTELYIEADLIDAATGLPVGKVVRKVFGKTLENDSQAISANDFKAAIKDVTNDMQKLMK